MKVGPCSAVVYPRYSLFGDLPVTAAPWLGILSSATSDPLAVGFTRIFCGKSLLVWSFLALMMNPFSGSRTDLR